jgi:hypothetical protein
MGRILYICHDIDAPRGGIGVLYDHVATLRAHGFDAYIVHSTKDFRYPFAPTGTPVLDASAGMRFLPTDTVVVPEDHTVAIHAFRNSACKKILFCQGHHNFFIGLEPGEAWANFGFSDYLCVSKPIQQAMQKWFGVMAHIIKPAINDIFFAEKPLAPAPTISVAYMPRKGAPHIRLVNGLARTSVFAQSPPIAWVEIDNLNRDQVAMRLHNAHVFLSTNSCEGLGLPPLEAMASGCLVVGFKGGGGNAYATDANGIWVPDDNPWALADALLTATMGLNDPDAGPKLEAKRLAGQKTALAYKRSEFEHDLVTFWEKYTSQTHVCS